jgi:hypothetical protein
VEGETLELTELETEVEGEFETLLDTDVEGETLELGELEAEETSGANATSIKPMPAPALPPSLPLMLEEPAGVMAALLS